MNQKWINRSGTLTYWSWRNMRNRCNDPGHADYETYGARGIKVCSRWLNDYDAFVEDMGLKPKGMSIDRIDNEGNYERDNCRWATDLQQASNRRDNLYVTHEGETKHSSEWARILGIDEASFRNRLARFDNPAIIFFKGKLTVGPRRTVTQYDL